MTHEQGIEAAADAISKEPFLTSRAKAKAAIAAYLSASGQVLVPREEITEWGSTLLWVERLEQLVRWAHDTLWEINPSNYDHADVCKLNDASVEVILGLAPALGETHGKSPEWWSSRAAAQEPKP